MSIKAADLAAYEKMVADQPFSEYEMSNFDHSIDEGLEADLRAGKWSCHSGLNFNGIVWWDGERKLFREAVSVFHVVQAIMEAASLSELMDTVNDEYGWL